MYLMDPRDIPKIVDVINTHRPFVVFAVPAHYTFFTKMDLNELCTLMPRFILQDLNLAKEMEMEPNKNLPVNQHQRINKQYRQKRIL